MKSLKGYPVGYYVFQFATAYLAALSVYGGYMSAASVFAFWAFCLSYITNP
jgi:hypothetical protein